MSDDKNGEAINAKLIAAKEKWARERRLITGQTDEAHVNRLPPGQRQVTNWPVLDLGLMPDVSKSDWR